MRKKELLEWPPAWDKRVLDIEGTMHGSVGRYAGVSQLVFSEGHDVLEIDLYRDGILKVRYFADKYTKKKACMVGGNWRNLSLANAAQVASGKPAMVKCWGWQYDVEVIKCVEDHERRIYDYLGESVAYWENSLESEKYTSKRQRRLRTIEAFMADVIPPEPDDLRDWISSIFPETYLFAIPKPKTTQLICSQCGGKTIVRKIVKGGKRTCRRCGKTGTVTTRERIDKTQPFYLLQPLKNGRGYVERKFTAVCTSHQGGRELGWYEEIRIVVNDGDTWGTCYYAYDNRPDVIARFQDTNPGQYRHAAALLYPDLTKVLPHLPEKIQHSGMTILALKGIRFNVNHMITSCAPWYEYAIKSGLMRLAIEDINASVWGDSVINHKGRTAEEVLKIDRGRIDRLRQIDGGRTALQWLQEEQETGKHISQNNLCWMQQHGITPDRAKGRKRFGSVDKYANWVRKQCMMNHASPSAILSEYADYLNMAKNQGLNLSHEIFYKPKDLKAAHDECVREGQKAVVNARAAGIREKFPKVEEMLSRIRDKYSYDGEEFSIVVPADITDIIHEGRALGHCIDTTDRYFDRIEKGVSFLVFLRRREQKSVPYYTLEIEPGGTIRQQRTTGNNQNKTEVKEYMPFIKTWQQVVKERISEEDRQKAEESRLIRISEYRELREKREKVWHGALAGKLLADVLEADLIEA